MENSWAVCFWLGLVLVLAVAIDRPIISALSAGPEWVVRVGEALEPFGDSGYPILGGALATLVLTLLAITAARGLEKRVLWSLTQLAAFICMSSFWSGFIVLVLKRVIGRPRPIKWLESGMYDWLPMQFQHLHVSMPSGHTTTVFTLAYTACALFPRFRWLILALAGGVALGRVMMHYHWPSDLIVGGLVAWILTRQVARLFVGSQGLFSLKLNGDFVASPVWAGYWAALTRMLKS